MFKLKSFLVAALMLAGLTAFAQQITVTGVVTSSADGYGVIGAAVMEKVPQTVPQRTMTETLSLK